MIWQSCGRLLLGCWLCGRFCFLLVRFTRLGSYFCFGRLFRLLFRLLLLCFLLFSFLLRVPLFLVGFCFLIFLFWVLFSLLLVGRRQIFLRARVGVRRACLFWFCAWFKSASWLILLSWFVLSRLVLIASFVFITSFMLSCFDICGRVMRCFAPMQNLVPCCFVILVRLLVLGRHSFIVCRFGDIHFFLFALVVLGVGSWLFSFSLCFMMLLLLVMRFVLFLLALLLLALLLFS